MKRRISLISLNKLTDSFNGLVSGTALGGLARECRHHLNTFPSIALPEPLVHVRRPRLPVRLPPLLMRLQWLLSVLCLSVRPRRHLCQPLLLPEPRSHSSELGILPRRAAPRTPREAAGLTHATQPRDLGVQDKLAPRPPPPSRRTSVVFPCPEAKGPAHTALPVLSHSNPRSALFFYPLQQQQSPRILPASLSVLAVVSCRSWADALLCQFSFRLRRKCYGIQVLSRRSCASFSAMRLVQCLLAS
jgi:hypothetical protein